MIQIKESMYEELARLADESGETVDSLVGNILQRYINVMKLQSKSDRDRRVSRREDISLPAMIYIRDVDKKTGWYRGATIVNISLSGVCVRVDKKGLSDLLEKMATTDKEFDILFSFSEAGIPVNFTCSAARIEEETEKYVIGAKFAQADPCSHSLMQRYLM